MPSRVCSCAACRSNVSLHVPVHLPRRVASFPSTQPLVLGRPASFPAHFVVRTCFIFRFIPFFSFLDSIDGWARLIPPRAFLRAPFREVLGDETNRAGCSETVRFLSVPVCFMAFCIVLYPSTETRLDWCRYMSVSCGFVAIQGWFLLFRSSLSVPLPPPYDMFLKYSRRNCRAGFLYPPSSCVW